jgi:hypothetical protein
MWKNLPVEFLNGRFRHVCSVWSGIVMVKNHSMLSTLVCLLDCFLQTAKLLTIVFSSDGQVLLKQFIMDNPLHISPDAPRARSVTHVRIALLEAQKQFLGCSFSNRAFSIDSTNVSGGLCCFGASIKLVKKKVLKMFIFLNLTLHSFGPENFLPLVKIGKFQKGLVEENESYKMVHYT